MIERLLLHLRWKDSGRPCGPDELPWPTVNGSAVLACFAGESLTLRGCSIDRILSSKQTQKSVQNALILIWQENVIWSSRQTQTRCPKCSDARPARPPMKGLQSEADCMTACKTTWRSLKHRNGEQRWIKSDQNWLNIGMAVSISNAVFFLIQHIFWAKDVRVHLYTSK